MASRRLTLSLVALAVIASDPHVSTQSTCGGGVVNTYHPAQCNASGKLIPWAIDASGPFHYIMGIEAQWWLNAPAVGGWPTYLTGAKLTRTYAQSGDAIPGSTVGMAVEAYLKYHVYTGNGAFLNMAKTMGDYIVQQGLTPASYVAYPKFPWPTGYTGDITPDGGGQGNTPGNVMPDKGAMVAIALLHLYEATGTIAYRDEATQIANVLGNTAVSGMATNSPWPFRANGNSGAAVDGPVMGNQVFALRLFDELLRLGLTGNGTYQTTRDNVWNWLKNVAIADSTGDHWLHFFEDHSGSEYNPTQFDALEMARYLLEKKEALDANWFSMAGSLITLVKNRWVVHTGDYTAIGEQQQDMTPYNSHTARYASILAKYFEAGGPAAYKDEAYSSFAYSTYSVDFDGFADTYFNGGIAWSSDSFGDWMQHFVDGIGAVADWAPGNSNHLLRSSSVVQSATYGSNSVSYATFDPAGQEKLKLNFTPTAVRVNGSSVTSWSWDSVSQVLVVNRNNGTSVQIDGGGSSPDFSISVTPASQSITVGASTAYTANIAASGGFTGTANLSVTGAPTGVTAAFSPTSVIGSGSSTLTVATSSTTAAGSYALTVAGTSGSLTHSTDVTLTIAAPSNTITFDDLSPANRTLTGQYPAGVINWGSGSWYLSGPWGLFTTQNISFNGAGPTTASFTFLSNSGLSSLQAYNGGSGSSTVSISCSGQATAQATAVAGAITTINTGWSTPCSMVTVASSNGWDTNFDNLKIFNGSSPAPDFSLAATPSTQTVVQGSSAGYTATVGALNGFSGTVALTVSGLPTGSSGTFTPNSVSGSDSSALNVTTNATTTPTGSYMLTITGTSGATTHNGGVSLVVNAPAPVDTMPPVMTNGRPTGTLAAGTTSTTLQLTTDEAATCRYGLTAGVNYSALPNLFVITGGTSHSTPVSGLVNGGTYKYYVRCADSVGNVNTTDFVISFAIAVPPSGGLVASFGFNEGSGTLAHDASGNGNNGTILNATWTTAGRYGKAVMFNGTNAWITIADAGSLDLTTGLTLEAWVRPTTTLGTSWRAIILKERSGGLCYSLYANTTARYPGAYINTGGNDLNVQGSSSIPTNIWTYLAATYDGTTLRLYVNGALVGSATVGGALVTSTGVLRIGGNSVWGEWFKGYIDEVRIYNRALSVTEITTDMNTAIVP